MKLKTFDCIAMKRRGAKIVQQALAGMTPEEELAYWQSGTEELRQRQRELHLLRQIEAVPTLTRTGEIETLPLPGATPGRRSGG